MRGREIHRRYTWDKNAARVAEPVQSLPKSPESEAAKSYCCKCTPISTRSVGSRLTVAIYRSPLFDGNRSRSPNMNEQVSNGWSSSNDPRLAGCAQLLGSLCNRTRRRPQTHSTLIYILTATGSMLPAAPIAVEQRRALVAVFCNTSHPRLHAVI